MGIKEKEELLKMICDLRDSLIKFEEHLEADGVIYDCRIELQSVRKIEAYIEDNF